MKQERENPISVMVFFVPREYNILLIHLMEKVFKLVHKSRNSIEVGAGLFFCKYKKLKKPETRRLSSKRICYISIR